VKLLQCEVKRGEKLDRMAGTRLYSATLRKKLYGYQEIWQAPDGEMIIVDSVVKLGERQNKASLLYCDLLQ
jgi:hypothetical protein